MIPQKSLILMFFFGVLMTSCIEFEKQTLTYKHDKKNDRLEIFQKFEGIYGKGGKKLSEEKVEQINSVINGERTFFFANWIFEYNREKLLELPKELEKEITESKNDAEKATMRKGVKLAKLLLTSIKVKNGEFYLNKEKKLCAYQYVTIDNLSKILKQTNEVISLAILYGNTKDDKPKEKSWALIVKAAKAGHTWISFDGNQLKVSCPVAKEDFIKAKKEFAKEVADTENSVKENAKFGEALKRILSNDLWVNYQNEVMEVTLGQPEDSTTAVTMNVFEGYSENLLKWAKEKKLIKNAPDMKLLKKNFLE